MPHATRQRPALRNRAETLQARSAIRDQRGGLHAYPAADDARSKGQCGVQQELACAYACTKRSWASGNTLSDFGKRDFLTSFKIARVVKSVSVQTLSIWQRCANK